MPRRKSLLAQMYDSHQKAKLLRLKEEERVRREWAAEERRTAAQMEKEAAQQRQAEERAARRGSGRDGREPERRRPAAGCGEGGPAGSPAGAGASPRRPQPSCATSSAE